MTLKWNLSISWKRLIIQSLRSQKSLSKSVVPEGMFTIVCHWSFSRARWIQSTPSYCTALKSILILYLHLRVGRRSGFLLPIFQLQCCTDFSSLPRELCAFVPSSCNFGHPNVWKIQNYEAPYIIFLSSLYFLSLWPNILLTTLFWNTSSLYCWFVAWE